MTGPSFPASLGGRYLLLQAACWALLVSVGVYVGLAWLILRSAEASALGATRLPTLLPPALVAVAALMLLAAPAVARSIVRVQRGVDGAVGEFVQATILAFALREAAAIIGLVLTLLSGRLVWCVGLAAAAVAAMALGWPRRELFEAVVQGESPPIE